ncbi:DNA alkylation repair protein [Prevotella sp. A2931]|uniref:DNA alkylation repair protein n=1 Tax=Prevotella illustrans TaxID=2800387 RepID=A0ABS3M607_9BACT|nr:MULTISPECIES: DNA alkylation repair protein [Prevotella]MBO1363569.1 DNA alkylation repair protein [Prevotella illustrans]PTL26197.1 DNA alkylation repair protein [Prevotella sp. oral taxon 820]
MTQQTNDIYEALQALHSEEKRLFLPHFFKTGKGEYGEGDRFMGVVVPKIRVVAKEFKDASLDTVRELLGSPWHEMRLCGLFILVLQAHKEVSKEIFNFYLSMTDRINNWDLVDLSAPQIVGGYLIDKPRDRLYRLAESPLLWENRIAMVATHTFIRRGDLEDTYRLATKMMSHPHDLMHKAIGWMLREAGKKDSERLYDYVEAHRQEMPRTMLRYAIEKFDGATRQWLMRK